MELVKMIIDLCMVVLQHKIYLFGFSVNLLNVLVWGLAIFMIVRLLFGIFK